MAFESFELIPFPISILFVLVVGLAFIAVLWKLRKTGRIYSVLFRVSVIAGIILLALFLYEIITNML
jgi:hypothetical protein